MSQLTTSIQNVFLPVPTMAPMKPNPSKLHKIKKVLKPLIKFLHKRSKKHSTASDQKLDVDVDAGKQIDCDCSLKQKYASCSCNEVNEMQQNSDNEALEARLASPVHSEDYTFTDALLYNHTDDIIKGDVIYSASGVPYATFWTAPDADVYWRDYYFFSGKQMPEQQEVQHPCCVYMSEDIEF